MTSPFIFTGRLDSFFLWDLEGVYFPNQVCHQEVGNSNRPTSVFRNILVIG
jgi:hypothetical protein